MSEVGTEGSKLTLLETLGVEGVLEHAVKVAKKAKKEPNLTKNLFICI